LGYETVEFPVTVIADQTVTINIGFRKLYTKDVLLNLRKQTKESALLLDQKNAVSIKQSRSQELSRKVSDVATAVTKQLGLQNKKVLVTFF
jgi:hypothetical protein